MNPKYKSRFNCACCGCDGRHKMFWETETLCRECCLKYGDPKSKEPGKDPRLQNETNRH